VGQKKSIINILKKFGDKISSSIYLNKMVLFGSFATGKTRKWSDIDLLIVSKSFKGLRPLDRGLDLYDMWDAKYPVDFLCYTPEEFEKAKKRIGIIRQILKEGKVIYSS